MAPPPRKRPRLQAPLSSMVAQLRQPHPYGVRPYGNLLLLGLEEARKALRSQACGLGVLSRLTTPGGDAARLEPLLEVLGYLQGWELARVLVCSRMCAAYAHLPELWRDACLRRGGRVAYAGTWKDTFAAVWAGPRHRSLNLKVYHNALHRLWCCGNFELQGRWFEAMDVPKVDGGDLHADDFERRFERPNRPVVLRGLLEEWTAAKRWTSDAYLIEACGDAQLRATSPAAPMAVRFTMAEYLEYCRSPPQEEAPLYLFERDFVQLCPRLGEDFRVPRLFDPFAPATPAPAAASAAPTTPRPTDLFRLYSADRRPDYRWLIAGPKLSGSVFHIDPNSTNAWNACIRGRKRWILYPPFGEPPPGILPSADGADVTLPLGLGEWFLSFWPYHKQRRSHPDPTLRPLEVTVEEGEVIFVPHGWWHLVLNLDDVCIAITQNYVSSANLDTVLDFLRNKEDQISGVRDRVQDGDDANAQEGSMSTAAVQPEHMHRELLEALEKHYPQLAEHNDVIASPVALRAGELVENRSLEAWKNLSAGGEARTFAFGFSIGEKE